MAAGFLERATVEVRYAWGATYLDRCGITMVDIQHASPGWNTNQVSPQNAEMVNDLANRRLAFNVDRFVLWEQGAKSIDIEGFAQEARGLWQIVSRNLGLDEVYRFGCRFHWISARKSIEDAERAVLEGPVRVHLPKSIESEFEPVISQPLVFVARGGWRFRIEVSAISRVEGRPPNTLLAVKPQELPKNQRDIRLKQIKARRAYESNPMFAVQLDIDCVVFDPEAFDLADAVLEAYASYKQLSAPLTRVLDR